MTDTNRTDTHVDISTNAPQDMHVEIARPAPPVMNHSSAANLRSWAAKWSILKLIPDLTSTEDLAEVKAGLAEHVAKLAGRSST